jgi:porin
MAGNARMLRFAVGACAVGVCSVPAALAMDLMTEAPQRLPSTESTATLHSSQSSEVQSYVFGDRGGLRSWLRNHGIDLGLSYLSESAWDAAGGRARGMTEPPQRLPSTESTATLHSSQSSEVQSYIFGDWGGLRSWLRNHGIDLGLSYLSESAWDVAGGRTRGGTYAGQENLRLTLDWEKIANLNGFSTHVDFVSKQGRNVSSEFVGDVLFQAQEIFGTPAVERAYVHLAYFYVEQQLFNGNVDLKVGRLSVLNDFGLLPDACDFISLAICGTRALIANLGWTVFPTANWGGMAEFKVSGPVSFKIGGYEVNPKLGGEYGFRWGLDGAIGVVIPAEIDWNVRLGPQQLFGIYKIGGSYDTSSYSEWYTAVNGLPLPLTTAPPRQTQRGTFYVLAQQKVWQPNSHSDQGLIVLAGYVYNTPEVSLFEHFAFVGLLYRGLLPWRPDDRAGFEIVYARVSPFLTQVQQLQALLGLPLSNAAPSVEINEIILEADYGIKLYEGLYLMPDLQYIIRPSATGTYPNAWVAGFRVTALF